MIRTLRLFFLGRVLREKLMLVGLLAVAVVLWASSYSSRGGQFWRAQHATTMQLKEQRFWLGRHAEIEAATHKAAAQMDPTKTLDSTGLSVEVGRLASEAGLTMNRGSVNQGAKIGQFSINSIRLNVSGANWDAFTSFYRKLQEEAPYLAITEIALQPMPQNPSQVTVVMNVVSFEIRH